MTELTFIDYKAQVTVVTTTGNKITRFAQIVNGVVKVTPLEGLYFSPAGIVKEFPDLKDKSIKEMRKIALERFKKHLEGFKTEKETIDYLINELEKHGNKCILITRRGHRPIIP